MMITENGKVPNFTGAHPLSEISIERPAEKDLQLIAYTKALIAEFSLKIDPQVLKVRSLNDEIVKLSFGRYSHDNDRLNSDGTAKKYSSIRLAESMWLSLYESENDSYILKILSASNIPQTFSRAQLDQLTIKHSDKCSTAQEKLADFERSIAKMDDQKLLETYNEFKMKGAIVGFENMPCISEVEERLRHAKFRAIVCQFGQRYDKIFNDSETPLLRQLLSSEGVVGSFLHHHIGESPSPAMLLLAVPLSCLYRMSVSWSSESKLRNEIWPDTFGKIGLPVKYRNDLTRGHIAIQLLKKDPDLRSLV